MGVWRVKPQVHVQLMFINDYFVLAFLLHLLLHDLTEVSQCAHFQVRKWNLRDLK